MNRKDLRAKEFEHWSPKRWYYQPDYIYEDMRFQIDCAYWESVDNSVFSCYYLWKFTH